MVAFDGNPYDDCERGDNVSTSVVALEIQQTDGSKVNLSDLQREIDIRIRHQMGPFDLDNEHFVLRVNGTSSQFHTFNHSLEEVVIAIEFFSEDDEIPEWKLMVAHEKRPSVQNNLASWSVQRNERKLFLLESSLLMKKGTHYVQVQGIPIGPKVANYVFNASYSLKISSLRCFFWNEMTERWSGAGCRVS